jgi:ABC-type nitrate/sulfonate/bicarbonate transport system ATPase subunit
MLLLDEPFGMLDSLTRLELQGVLLELWQKQRITALMVTHDVDEALFLSDRVAMMTSGPGARLGAVLDVPFERPRKKSAVLEHPRYYALRDELIGFLEEQEHGGSSPRAPEPTPEELPDEAADSAARMALAG